MSRPNYTPTNLQSNAQGWDATVNANLAAARATMLAVPFPVFEAGVDEVALPTAFPPGQYDRCVCWVNHTTLGWVLMYSDGTTWRVYSRGAAHADSVATTVAGIVADFNGLLAKLRTGKVIA